MASSSRSRSRSRSRRKQYRKGKACSGGGSGSSKRRSRSRTDKKRKTHKWSQKGCQSGGSSVVGTGSAWHPSGMEHQTAGSASASAYATNSGNHFSLNTNTLAPPQSSNHLVEKGILAGGGRSRRHGRKGNKRGRKHRHFIGEQSGGMIRLLPETVKLEINNATQMPASAMNVIQGAATPVASADPTIQPIGRPLLHQM
jgi:hypothetical protein